LSPGCPCAGPDAPLATIELVAACFRFAMDGDVGAGGRAGGVRVPLAAMVMVIRDARDVVGVERAQAAEVVASSVSASPTFPAARKGEFGLQLRERDHGAVDCDR
jgi:hypothetical protein